MKEQTTFLKKLSTVCYLMVLLFLFIGCSSNPSSNLRTITSKQLDAPIPHVEAAAKVNDVKLNESKVRQLLPSVVQRLLEQEARNKETMRIFFYDEGNPIWETAQGSFINFQCTALITADENISEASETILSSFTESKIINNTYTSFTRCGAHIDLSLIHQKSLEIAEAKRLQDANEEAQPKKTAANDQQQEIRTKSLGYGFEEFMRYLSSTFPSMEFQPLPDGRDQFVGQANNGVAAMFLTGDSKDLEEVSILVTLPVWSPSALIENYALLLRFMRNAAPEWDGGIDWLQDSLERIIDLDQEKIVTRKNGRIFTITVLHVLGTISLTVEPV